MNEKIRKDLKNNGFNFIKKIQNVWAIAIASLFVVESEDGF